MAKIKGITGNTILDALRYGLSKDLLASLGGDDTLDGGESLEVVISDDGSAEGDRKDVLAASRGNIVNIY